MFPGKTLRLVGLTPQLGREALGALGPPSFIAFLVKSAVTAGPNHILSTAPSQPLKVNREHPQLNAGCGPDLLGKSEEHTGIPCKQGSLPGPAL